MNRNFTLILSVILVIVLLAIWIYLMFFANRSEEGGEVVTETGQFAELDGLQGDSVDGGSINNNEGGGFGQDGTFNEEQFGAASGELPILRQLTTRNVIGYQELQTSSTTHIVFMESGVGHIYRIDLETGDETRISATTIPDARQAVFSQDGKWVVVKTGEDTGLNPIQLGLVDMDNKAVTLTEVADAAYQFAAADNNTLLYTTVTNNNAVVNRFNIETRVNDVLFTTLFREAIVLFGTTVDGPHYFLPKTSRFLEGFLYQVSNGTFNRLPLDGFGFSSYLVDEDIISSHRKKTNLVSSLYDTETGELVELPTSVIPEKCVGVAEKLYCAQPDNKQLNHNSIDRWLQGVDSFADNLWVIEEEPELLINITSFSGRDVDVMNGLIGRFSDDWYFQNKTDNSLWIYELSRLTDEELISEENI